MQSIVQSRRDSRKDCERALHLRPGRPTLYLIKILFNIIDESDNSTNLKNAFINFKYPNEIGPGVYDIHSPRVPTQQEVEQLLDKALSVLNVEQVWVNPDCGLKTRDWPETKTALQIMVNATKQLRAKIQ